MTLNRIPKESIGLGVTCIGKKESVYSYGSWNGEHFCSLTSIYPSKNPDFRTDYPRYSTYEEFNPIFNLNSVVSLLINL